MKYFQSLIHKLLHSTCFRKVKSPSSSKIESLGVDMADIQDDIMDASTDQESDPENKPHQHMLRSQPIGKLYVEQSSKFSTLPVLLIHV